MSFVTETYRPNISYNYRCFFSPEWTEWKEITDSDRDPNWMPVFPHNEILFSVETNIVGYKQGIRFYVRSSVDDVTGTLVNINIPENSEGSLLAAISGCSTENGIVFSNLIPEFTTMDWYFVKTAEKFEVWCQGRMYHRQLFSDNSIDCQNKMRDTVTHVKFRPTDFDHSKKIRMFRALLSTVIFGLYIDHAIVQPEDPSTSSEHWSEWDEWKNITVTGRDPNWMSVYPYDKILFSVQTKKELFTQGIRFYIRSNPDDDTGTYVNINIPVDSEGPMLVAIVGCWTEHNIELINLYETQTADWTFVKTAEKFEVWCEGELYLTKRFADGDVGCSDKMRNRTTHVKFKSTDYDHSQKIRFALPAIDEVDPPPDPEEAPDPPPDPEDPTPDPEEEPDPQPREPKIGEFSWRQLKLFSPQFMVPKSLFRAQARLPLF
ncbi:hypothetical protein ACHWQZ_G004369 [Mnemiopsis leidyi]